MSDQPTEYEASFTCPSRAVGDVLYIHRLVDLMRIEDQQVRLTDSYFDSPELSLHRQGYALRIREDAHGTRIATFKGPPGSSDRVVQQRIEIETDFEALDPPLDRGRPIGLYQEIPAFVEAQAIVGDVLIQPIAQIVNNRRTMTFRSTLDRHIELSIDRVSGVRLRDYHRSDFLEVEIELLEGERAGFDRIVADLQAQAPELRPDLTTKLARIIDAG